MTNALVNRIKQRLESQRQFMRTVFSNHHALVWRLTDAPSLRALGMKPKPLESSRTRAIQPREVKVQPRNARVNEIPDLNAEVVENQSSFEITETVPETSLENQNFDTLSELEPLMQTEPAEESSVKLEPQRAREILERREAVTAESRADVVPSVRSDEVKPSDVLARENTENVVSKGVIAPLVEMKDVENLPMSNSEETRVLEQNQPLIATESFEPGGQKTVQHTNISEIEQHRNAIEPKKTEEIQATPNKPLTASSASEILQQRADLEMGKIASIPETQKIDATSEQQLKKPVSIEDASKAVRELEPEVQITSEHQESNTESQVKPERVAREAQEVLETINEIPTKSEIQPSNVETKPEFSVPEIKASVPVIGETRDLEIPSSVVTPQETIPDALTVETRDVEKTRVVEKTVQETVFQQSPQNAVVQEPQQEFMARESQQESDSQEQLTAQETRTEPQTQSDSVSSEPAVPSQSTASSQPTVSTQPTAPEPTVWQRSIPGDPQSGVVEIIRAKPPQNVRLKGINKPTEAREASSKTEPQNSEPQNSEPQNSEPQNSEPQNSKSQISPSQAEASQSRQTLAERMESLQNRYGTDEKTRVEPSTDLSAQTAEVEPPDDAKNPTPQFQSISDVAQRLARRYSETLSPNQNEAANQQPDLKVGQTLNTTQTRAANAFVQQGTQPVQLRQSTRTFLEPLIGFDPSQARVFVGPQATELTSNLNADGATVGTDIYLNNGFDEQTPEGMGLLAHELTHVGQNLKPDFVPPMLQSTPGQQDFSNESFETQARVVEARVTNTASVFIPGIALEGASRQTTTAPMVTSPKADVWNGLPAPWEAIPNVNTNATDFVTVVSPNAPDSSATTSTGLASVNDAPSELVQLADSDRPSENRDNAPPGAAGGQPPQQPGQDMDVLAQQVYEILKRRLSSERRREG
jgi:hypothetical protein